MEKHESVLLTGFAGGGTLQQSVWTLEVSPWDVAISRWFVQLPAEQFLKEPAFLQTVPTSTFPDGSV